MLKLDDRVWARFAKKVAWPPSMGACWRWTACHCPQGYGRINIGGEIVPAYRVAYTMMVGPIPEGLHIDHLCRTRECVNPLHLEPVPKRVNDQRGESVFAQNLRKTHCPQGHPYSAENTVRHGGGRQCRTCANEQSRRAHWRRKGYAEPPSDRPKNGDKTHCPQGHAYDEANTRRRPDGSRGCRACDRASVARRWARRKASAAR